MTQFKFLSTLAFHNYSLFYYLIQRGTYLQRMVIRGTLMPRHPTSMLFLHKGEPHPFKSTPWGGYNTSIFLLFSLINS